MNTTLTNQRFTINRVRETESHKKSSHTARGNRRAEIRKTPMEFICVDGEGMNFPSGKNGWVLLDEHRYVLLGVGDQQITDENGLDFIQCCEFLYSQFRTGGVAFTGFFLGYDFIQMLKTLPEERARMLLTKEGKAKRQPKSERVQPFPVEYKGWEFEILGTKRLKIRPQGHDETRLPYLNKSTGKTVYPGYRWMYICDTGPFFQKSFLKVIDPKEWSDPVVTQEEYETIREGKSRRSSAVLDADMLRYNALENEILSRVLQQLDIGFRSLGIHLSPKQWMGPGQAAQEWLDGRAITSKRLSEVVPQEVLECARMSYFGGWFEIMAHGIIPGITYEYDINSAYPYIISQLPCLEHGSWEHRKSFYKKEFADLPGSPYCLVYARVWGTHNGYVGSMMHRQPDGHILRPYDTEGWYWLHELEASQRAGLVKNYTIKESWNYTPCECPPPFREVRDIYALRKKVGKKTPLGIACKLVPNSLYGKFAQSVGEPKYGNSIYASLVTAGCRTMILNAIETHPNGYKNVVMVATDGVYFTEPHTNLPISAELGDWDTEEKSNLCLFKPGVYWDDRSRADILAGKNAIFKARGVNAKDFGSQIQKIDFQFGELANGNRHVWGLPGDPKKMRWPSVEFPLSFAMVTALQALQRNDWSLAGTIIREPMGKQSSIPREKRAFVGWEDNGKINIYRSNPYEFGTGFWGDETDNPIMGIDKFIASTPYEKRFGMELTENILAREAITPDGDGDSLIAEALYYGDSK